MEYDFVVAPGADPKVIQLVFEGADRVKTNGQGDLVLYIADGEPRFRKPQVYQEINGTMQPISGNYVLLSPENLDDGQRTTGSGQQAIVNFQVAAYDASKPLVIDPVLSYSTYLGGGSNDDVEGIAVDVCGSGFDQSFDIAVDASGNVYVTGRTVSTDFPIANSLQPANNGREDAFIAKISDTGTTPIPTPTPIPTSGPLLRVPIADHADYNGDGKADIAVQKY